MKTLAKKECLADTPFISTSLVLLLPWSPRTSLLIPTSGINSNQRCVFIHDTDDVSIDDNVAFDTAGHCYATETGSERNNVFTHNLGAYTKKLTRSNGQSDSPGKTGGGISTFWIRNMENTL